MVPTFLIVGTILLVVFWGVSHREKQRTEQLKLVAAQMGLPFYPTGDSALMEKLSGFHLFSQGRSRKIRNLLHGVSGQLGIPEDVEVGIFGYRYTTGGGQHSRTTRQSVIYFRSPQLNLPQFALRPENLFHRIGDVLGYQDIDFDSYPTFSAKYLLRGNDERKVRDVFTHEVQAFFEAKEGVSTEGDGDQLIFYRGRKRIKPEDVRAFMEEGLQVFRLFKQ